MTRTLDELVEHLEATLRNVRGPIALLPDEARALIAGCVYAENSRKALEAIHVYAQAGMRCADSTAMHLVGDFSAIESEARAALANDQPGSASKAAARAGAESTAALTNPNPSGHQKAEASLLQTGEASGPVGLGPESLPNPLPDRLTDLRTAMAALDRTDARWWTSTHGRGYVSGNVSTLHLGIVLDHARAALGGNAIGTAERPNKSKCSDPTGCKAAGRCSGYQGFYGDCVDAAAVLSTGNAHG